MPCRHISHQKVLPEKSVLEARETQAAAVNMVRFDYWDTFTLQIFLQPSVHHIVPGLFFINQERLRASLLYFHVISGAWFP